MRERGDAGSGAAGPSWAVAIVYPLLIGLQAVFAVVERIAASRPAWKRP